MKDKWFGIWNKGGELDNEPEGEDAIIEGINIYCPICRKQMKMWIEGCCLLHITCKGCKFKFTVILKNEEMYKKLEDLIYKVI